MCVLLEPSGSWSATRCGCGHGGVQCRRLVPNGGQSQEPGASGRPVAQPVAAEADRGVEAAGVGEVGLSGLRRRRIGRFRRWWWTAGGVAVAGEFGGATDDASHRGRGGGYQVRVPMWEPDRRIRKSCLPQRRRRRRPRMVRRRASDPLSAEPGEGDGIAGTEGEASQVEAAANGRAAWATSTGQPAGFAAHSRDLHFAGR